MLEARMNAEGINLTALVGLVLEARKTYTAQCKEFIARVEEEFNTRGWEDEEGFDWASFPEEWDVYQDWITAHMTVFWIPAGIRKAVAERMGVECTRTFHSAFDKAMESAEPAYWAWIESQGW